ncbi:hypothetical protein AVEN_151788-1 [Araneus ventricosus]|uniref:Uncharacterized protein n=1 Tax=Araneus ventricosus TaxID=182803 RepID=A0A4Y2IYK8_ARAVE|nr:hypothetical protein AVEN_151788-1 [Araneus ventricosus]
MFVLNFVALRSAVWPQCQHTPNTHSLLSRQFIYTPFHPFVPILVFFHPFKSKNQGCHSSEAPKCADSRSERSFLPLYRCSSIPPIFPTQRSCDKGSLVARSQSSQIV